MKTQREFDNEDESSLVSGIVISIQREMSKSILNEYSCMLTAKVYYVLDNF